MTRSPFQFPAEPYTGSDRAVLKRMLATLRLIHSRAKNGRTGLHADPDNVKHNLSVAAGLVEGLLTQDQYRRKTRP